MLTIHYYTGHYPHPVVTSSYPLSAMPSGTKLVEITELTATGRAVTAYATAIGANPKHKVKSGVSLQATDLIGMIAEQLRGEYAPA